MGSSGQSRAGRPARRIRFRPVGAQTWDRVPSFRCRRLSLASDDPIWTLSRAETRGDGANLAMRLAFRAAGFDHEIGARALDPVGGLQGADRPELGGGHAGAAHDALALDPEDRKSTRLNSSH